MDQLGSSVIKSSCISFGKILSSDLITVGRHEFKRWQSIGVCGVGIRGCWMFCRVGGDNCFCGGEGWRVVACRSLL